MNGKDKWQCLDYFLLLFLLVVAYWVFFADLSKFTVRLWDEGRNGINAIEMMRNKKFFVTYYMGKPDMWNVKPPLFIWVLVTFFKTLGVNELSLRLPSALSAVGLVVLMFWASRKIFSNVWIGFVSGLVFMSSMGFSDVHVGRTGDYDSLLTLLTFCFALFCFFYVEIGEKKWLWLAALFLWLAVMAKGVAGLFFIPGILAYLLLTGKTKIFLRREVWLAAGVFLVGFGSYLLLREKQNPGYITAWWRLEAAGRFLVDKAGSVSSENWTYYWKYLIEFRFQKWVFWFIASILSYFLIEGKTKFFVLWAYVLAMCYMLLISVSDTKQLWYDAQAYPLMSMLVAIFMVSLIGKLPLFWRIAPILIFVFYSQRYLRTNIAYIHRPDLDKENECIKYGYLFRDSEQDWSGFVGVHSDFCNPLDFYLVKNGLLRKDLGQVVTGDKFFTCDGVVKNKIADSNLSVEVLFDRLGCVGLLID